MTIHKAISSPKGGIFIPLQPRHLVQKGTFTVDHFIVGQNKNVLLAQIIIDTEAQLVMVKLLEIRV